MAKCWRVASFTMLVLVLCGQPVAIAQSGDPVTITGRLTAFEPASDILIRTTAGLPVTLTLTGPEMDVELAVYDAVGQLVEFNDDNDTALRLPSARDAALIFTPALSDLMIVRVATLGWAYTGSYTLTLEGVDVIEQNPVSILQNASGSVVEGVLTEIPDRVPHVAYGFSALAGWPVTIRLVSADFDTVLDVYNTEGDLIASNDDHPEEVDLPNRTDSVVSFEAPADGMYVALVRSYQEEGTGRFTLAIDGAVFGTTVSVQEQPEEGVCDRVLGSVVAASSSFGGGYSAENLIDDNLTTGWSSRGDDDSPYIIFEVSTGATVRLDGIEFDGFSASPGFVNDSVQQFEVGVATTLVDPEAFTIVLEAVAPLENALQSFPFAPVEARYVLLRPLTNYGGGYFQATEFNACTSLTGTRSGNLTGDPPYVATGQLLADEDFVEYRLYAHESAEMLVTVTSEAFDPVVEVYNESGRRLADNDDHLEEIPLPRLWDAGLTLQIVDPGMVAVRIRARTGGGTFALTIDGSRIQAQPPEVPLLPPCDDVSSAAEGGAVVGFSSEFGGRWLAEYLNDGSTETGWASAPGRQSQHIDYVIIDLAGGIREITSFRINPSATGGDSSAHNVSRFAVLVSTTDIDPDSFEEVFSTLLTERYRYTLAFDLPQPVEARYVMLETRDTFGGRWHEVAEFTVCAAN